MEEIPIKEKVRVSVVVVTYNPSDEDIAYIRAMAEVWRGAIVDNSGIPFMEGALLGKMVYLPQKENLGLAKAQNIGIVACLEESNVSHIVFLDQDSRPGSDFPERMAEEYERIKEIIPNLASLGPMIIERQTGREYGSAIHRDKVLGGVLLERESVITSGSCIGRSVIETVGMADERLFIDYVDSEWCWRARAKGFVCGQTPNISISHQVGRKLIKLGPFRDIVSAPFRYYYQSRNYLWLVRRSYAPRQWKLLRGIKFLMRLVYVPLFTKQGWLSTKYMWKGIVDGMNRA